MAYVLVVPSKTKLYLSPDPSDIDHICLGLIIEYVADPPPKGYRRVRRCGTLSVLDNTARTFVKP